MTLGCTGTEFPTKVPTAPYDSLINVLNGVNSRLNGVVDTLTAIGGQILTNTSAKSQQFTNNGWRKLQQYLVSEGCVRLRVPNFIIRSLPPVNTPDTSLQVTLSWSGYSDGVNLLPAFALPQDLIKPLEMAERPSSGVAPNAATFTDIDLKQIDRIPSIPKLQWNQIAVWNDDKIFMPGATVITDLRIDYAAYFPDFLDTGTTTVAAAYARWFQQTVPILRALDPLADYICAEVEAARGNIIAAQAYTEAGRRGAMEAIIGKVVN